MSMSNSRLAYSDCFRIMDEAVEDEGRGKRVRFPSYGDAVNFRLRLHHARAIDRVDNKGVYPEEHPLHGRSEYDRLVMRIKVVKEEYYVYVEKRDHIVLVTESIEEDE